MSNKCEKSKSQDSQTSGHTGLRTKEERDLLWPGTFLVDNKPPVGLLKNI